MEGMPRLQRLVAVGLALLATVTVARAADDGAHDLVKRVLDAAPKVPLTARASLTSDRGWVRDLALSRARVGEADASYMEVTAPIDLKDTRFLLFDRAEGRDEQYMYVPSVKRAMQVSNETRKQPFLGSDFYISDMVRPELAAYTYRTVGEEEVAQRKCTLVEAVPKDPENELYSKTVSAIDPKDLLVVRVQFFDPKGKPLKTWTLEKVEKIDGMWTPLVQKMADLQDGHESRITLTDVKYNVQLPDATFTRTHLTR
jgi:outer membrane lipoprotein-sorting protein